MSHTDGAENVGLPCGCGGAGGIDRPPLAGPVSLWALPRTGSPELPGPEHRTAAPAKKEVHLLVDHRFRPFLEWSPSLYSLTDDAGPGLWQGPLSLPGVRGPSASGQMSHMGSAAPCRAPHAGQAVAGRLGTSLRPVCGRAEEAGGQRHRELTGPWAWHVPFPRGSEQGPCVPAGRDRAFTSSRLGLIFPVLRGRG